MVTERHWDPEDAQGVVTERKYQNGHLVQSATTVTRDPSIARTYTTEVTQASSTADDDSAGSSHTFVYRQPLFESSVRVLDVLLQYLTKQVWFPYNL